MTDKPERYKIKQNIEVRPVNFLIYREFNIYVFKI